MADIMLATALAACGGGSGGTATTKDARTEAGCPAAQEEETEELYVRHLYSCNDHSLYVFNDKAARDNWRNIAEQVGGVVLQQGDNWILAK